MIDWKPIKNVPTIDLYNFSAPMPNLLLFHPEGYALGYAYIAYDGHKVVCAMGWTAKSAAECTHWALLVPPTKKKIRSTKTPSDKRPSVAWPQEFKKIMRKAVLG